VAQAREYICSEIGGGTCPSHPSVLKAINNAQMEILNNEDPMLSLRRVRFFTKKNMICLPREAERIMPQFKVDEYPCQVKSMFYEFLPGGTWTSDDIGLGTGLVDWGDHHATMFEIDEDYAPTILMAFSTAQSDDGKTLFLKGYGAGGKEVLTAGVPGETLVIKRWLGGVEGNIDGNTMVPSTSRYTQVEQVVKPVTEGYVTLMGYDQTTHYMWNIAIYHPRETNPQFHWYKVPAPRNDDGTSIVALVKLRHVPLVADTDVLLVQNLEALKFKVMSNEHMKGNPQLSAAYSQNCYGMLKSENAKKHPDTDISLSNTWGVGHIPQM
jgi:hypothetical protein